MFALNLLLQDVSAFRLREGKQTFADSINVELFGFPDFAVRGYTVVTETTSVEQARQKQRYGRKYLCNLDLR